MARALQLPVQHTDELQELRPGAADGMTRGRLARALRRRGGDPYRAFAPGGESWAGFLVRVGAALTDLVDRHPDETVVAVCHGGVVEASFSLVFGLGGEQRPGLLRHAQHQHHPLAAPARARRAPASGPSSRFNDAGHLAGAATPTESPRDAVPTPTDES